MALERRLYTEDEAAQYFGWSVHKQREIRKLGLIEYIQFNDQTIRYTIDQLEAFQLKFIKSKDKK
jgi:hypothetical protein